MLKHLRIIPELYIGRIFTDLKIKIKFKYNPPLSAFSNNFSKQQTISVLEESIEVPIKNIWAEFQILGRFQNYYGQYA